MKFNITDFEGMRNWLIRKSFNSRSLALRLEYFDRLRYAEDYETIYDFIEEMGGHFE